MLQKIQKFTLWGASLWTKAPPVVRHGLALTLDSLHSISPHPHVGWSLAPPQGAVVIVQSLSHVQLFSDPMDCSPPGSSVHGNFQARLLEWVATSFSRGSSQPRDWTHNSWMGRRILYCWATWEATSGGRKLQKSSTKHLRKPSFFRPTLNL